MRRGVAARWIAALCAVALVAGCAAGSDSGTERGSGDGPSASQAALPDEPAVAPLRAGESFLELGLPGGAYRPEPAPGSLEDYRCFLLDPELDADAFLTGSGFLPDNRLVLHHAIVYRVTPDKVALAQDKDSADDDPGWSCFGGPGLEQDEDPIKALNSASWLSAWAPGGGESAFRAGTGMPLQAGSQVVLQVHYHVERGFQGVDSSSIRLRLQDGSAPLKPLRTTLLVAPVELPCTPGQSGSLCDRERAVLDVMNRFGYQAGRTVAGLQLLCDGDPSSPASGPTQSCDRTVDEAMVVHAAAGHMHLRGRSISIVLNPGTPASRVLLDVPAYDFDNQGMRLLDEPVLVSKGDTLRVTCTHDNGLSEQVPELQAQDDRYVVWGEGTTDEMCLGILSSTAP